MRLVQISDCHLLADRHRTLYDINPYTSLENILRDIATTPPQGLMVTGDISGDDSAESYGHFVHLMSQYLPACAWRVIPGNHDSNAHFSSCFARQVLLAGVGWELGNWMVHGLDSRHEEARGRLQADELAAVGDAMLAAKDHYHLVVVHHHPKPSHSWMDRHCLENPQLLGDWLIKYPQVAGILHGHIHAEQEGTISGVPVLSVPSTCWQWDLQPDFAVDDNAPGYREIQLSPDGEWTTIIRRVVK